MELRSHGPLYMLDRALSALRAGGGTLAARAVLGSLPLGLCVLALDYFEQVEGVRGLRAPLSLAIVLAFLLRSVVLSRVARSYALLLRPTLPVIEPAPRAIEVASSAGVVGFGLLVWLIPLLLFAVAAPLALVAIWPLTSLRGAVAPSWLARASCAREHGRAAYGQAFDDAAGMRGVLSVVELLVQLGTLALLANLFALTSIVFTLGHAMFGLDVAFVSAFASPDNPWTLLVLATVTMLAFEPLRAAVSAQAFVEARTRRDGADLYEAVDAAIESGQRRARGLGAAALLLLAASAWRAPLQAQAPDESAGAARSYAPGAAASANAADAAVRARVASILARDEFREHSDEGTLSRWFARLGAWLETLELQEDERERSSVGDGGGGAATAWGVLVLVLLALAALAWLLRAPGRLYVPALGDAALGDAGASAGAPAADAREVAGDDPRHALRALYLATLAQLDRAGRLELDASKTNGQHLRALPAGPSRRALAELTRIFDRAWYGRAPATPEDLARGRALAAQVLGGDDATTRRGGIEGAAS